MYQTTIHTVAQTGESLAELAYRQLEEMIVTLKLEPGSIVNERALTDITGMGRTPVREAVQKLAWEGLMEIRPRSGIAIAPLNLQDFGKISGGILQVEIHLNMGSQITNEHAFF